MQAELFVQQLNNRKIHYTQGKCLGGRYACFCIQCLHLKAHAAQQLWSQLPHLSEVCTVGIFTLHVGLIRKAEVPPDRINDGLTWPKTRASPSMRSSLSSKEALTTQDLTMQNVD